MQVEGDCDDRERRPVSFPEWKSALAGVENQLQESYRQEVVWFLYHCKKLHAPATIALARSYLHVRETTSGGPAHEHMSPILAAGKLPIKTVGQPISMGPPT